MRDRAADKSDIAHARQMDVSEIAAIAVQKARIFQPVDRMADNGEFAVRAAIVADVRHGPQLFSITLPIGDRPQGRAQEP